MLRRVLEGQWDLAGPAAKKENVIKRCKIDGRRFGSFFFAPTVTHVLSFVAFASLLAGLSELSLRGAKHNHSVKNPSQRRREISRDSEQR